MMGVNVNDAIRDRTLSSIARSSQLWVIFDEVQLHSCIILHMENVDANFGTM